MKWLKKLLSKKSDDSAMPEAEAGMPEKEGEGTPTE